MSTVINLISSFIGPKTEATFEASLNALAAEVARYFGCHQVGILTARGARKSATLTGCFPMAGRKDLATSIADLHRQGAIGIALEAKAHHSYGSWTVQAIHDDDRVYGAMILNLAEVDLTQTAELGFIGQQLGAQIAVSRLHEKMLAGHRNLPSKLAFQAKEVAFLSEFDALTKLPNLRSLNGFLDAKTRDEPEEGFWLVWLRIVDFHRINQGFGHDCGDAVLVEVAERLQRVLGHQHGVARVAGDSFGVYASCEHYAEQADLEHLVKQLIAAITQPFQWQDIQLPIKCGAGAVSYPVPIQSTADLLIAAEVNANHAIQNMVNTVEINGSIDKAKRSRRLLVEAQLNKSLSSGQFELYYQPKIEITSGKLVGAEALLRWHHGENGMVEPDDFLEIAERGDQIAQLGRWVLREACRRLRLWRDEGHKSLVLSINLSPKQLHRQDLVADVAAALREFSLPPYALQLELTESIAAADQSTVSRRFGELKKLGVQLALDDFGKGYTGLATLKKIPATSIKLDRSFIQDVVHDEVDQAIVESVVQMAHKLGKRVVAEGVESLAQMEYLKKIGCDEAQGYFIRPPISAQNFYQLLQEWNAENTVE
ncbi:MAG: bifunctional diguanylate cyclase/phosphodiesterase [Gammaproteobacteria bacterium]|nr:bifunctional diguanylate cyclase/phosphodiesterase [Gammaproteobacteria bacterium]